MPMKKKKKKIFIGTTKGPTSRFKISVGRFRILLKLVCTFQIRTFFLIFTDNE